MLILHTYEFEDLCYEKIISEINKSRAINSNLIESFFGVKSEPHDFELYPDSECVGIEIQWTSKELSKKIKNKYGEVSSISVVESILYGSNNEELEMIELLISYFNENPRTYINEVLIDDFDSYQFVGFDFEAVEKCAEEIAEYWNLSEKTTQEALGSLSSFLEWKK